MSLDSQLPQDEFYTRAYKAPKVRESNPIVLGWRGIAYFSSLTAANLGRGAYVGIDSYSKDGVKGLYDATKQVPPAYNLAVGAFMFMTLGLMYAKGKLRFKL